MSHPPQITNNLQWERSQQSQAMAHWTPGADDSSIVPVNDQMDWATGTTLAVRERSTVMMLQPNRPPQAHSPEKELLLQEVLQMQYSMQNCEANAMNQVMLHIQQREQEFRKAATDLKP